MFVVGLRGLPALFVFIFFIVVVIFGGPCVHGRPTEAQSWQDTRRDHSQSSPPLTAPLRYSPELMLEPSLESAVSPVNVLPRPLPPSSPSVNDPPSNNDHSTGAGNYNNVGNYNNQDNHYNSLGGNPNNEDNHFLGSHDSSNLDNQNRNPAVVAGDVSKAKEFSQDLDGPEDKWEQDPDLVDSDSELAPPPQSWPQRIPTELPKNKVMAPPAVVEDDVNVDRFHGHLLGFHEADGNEDLEVPELRLKIRDREPFRSVSAGSGYVPVPRKAVDQDASSTEVITGVAKAETSSSPKANIPMPDDVPVNPHRALPWQEVLAKDIDVDKPIPQDNVSPPVPQPASRVPDTVSLQHWKHLVLEELDEAGHTAARHGGAGGGDMASTEVNLDQKKNPFEEEEENEVPEELVRRVVEAMEAPPGFWRLSAAGADDEEDMGDMWESSGDGQGEDDDDEYLDYWVLPQHDSPWNSRLLTLILETVDDPEEILIYEDEEMGEEEDEGEDSTDTYEKELSIWQILTNFPFPMLLHHSDDTRDPFNDDYIYDDDDDYEDYDDEEYDEDDYEDEYDEEYDDDDEYDDEDYEDDEDEDEDEGDGSESLDDYFYSEDYEDCEDCEDDDGEAKPEITILSLPPIFTK